MYEDDIKNLMKVRSKQVSQFHLHPNLAMCIYLSEPKPTAKVQPKKNVKGQVKF